MRREKYSGWPNSTRIHDFTWKRLTVGFDRETLGGMLSPSVFVAWDGKGDSPSGIVRRSHRLMLPYLRWAYAYRLRRFGGLRLYVAQYKLLGVVLRHYSK